MKNLYFLVYVLISIIPLTSHARMIEIIAEDGTPLNIPDTATVRDFFERCRKDNHCFSNNLALDFDNKLIKEKSNDAHLSLNSHASWFFSSNQAQVATLNYAQRRPILNNVASSYLIQQKNYYRLIDVEAPNGRIKQCSSAESPADFFRKCRNSGDCSNPLTMNLRFDNHLITEDSQMANRPFHSFNANSSFAQARYR